MKDAIGRRLYQARKGKNLTFPKHTAVQSPEIKQIVKLLNQMDHKSVRFILDIVQAYRATLN